MNRHRDRSEHGEDFLGPTAPERELSAHAPLGLAKLYESRGASWRPSDEEVSAYLELEGNGA